MNRKTYNILCHLPIVGSIIRLKTDPMLFNSMGMSDPYYMEHVIKPVEEYAKKHPDVAITNKVVDEILSGKRK